MALRPETIHCPAAEPEGRIRKQGADRQRVFKGNHTSLTSSR